VKEEEGGVGAVFRKGSCGKMEFFEIVVVGIECNYTGDDVVHK